MQLIRKVNRLISPRRLYRQVLLLILLRFLAWLLLIAQVSRFPSYRTQSNRCIPSYSLKYQRKWHLLYKCKKGRIRQIRYQLQLMRFQTKCSCLCSRHRMISLVIHPYKLNLYNLSQLRFRHRRR